MSEDDQQPPDWHGIPHNIDLDEIPEIKDLLTPFYNRNHFNRQALGHIKLAFYRGQHEVIALRADVEALAVAAREFTEGTGDGVVYFDKLRKALDRDGVRKVLEGVKDAV